MVYARWDEHQRNTNDCFEMLSQFLFPHVIGHIEIVLVRKSHGTWLHENLRQQL